MMYYRMTGEGPPMVFIHGAGASGRLFGNQFQAFRDRARCYFLDLPGHGESAESGELTIEGYARAVVDFLASLTEPVTLVGHSMGGAVALKVALDCSPHPAGFLFVALRAPDGARGEGSARQPNLKQLILVGTGCRLPVSPKILTGLETGYENTLDAITRYCFSKSVDPDLLNRARLDIRQASPDVVRADFHACNAFNCCDRLAQITVPTLIICGENDVMTPPSFSRELQQSIPNARLQIIPRASHMLMLEFPEQFNAALR
ncbi:MAG: alpha/beta hydrolase [Acidobacteria bacterium]|nr:alpha/beta hydrolase [Acidobacteriota bacterium]